MKKRNDTIFGILISLLLFIIIVISLTSADNYRFVNYDSSTFNSVTYKKLRSRGKTFTYLNLNENSFEINPNHSTYFKENKIKKFLANSKEFTVRFNDNSVQNICINDNTDCLISNDEIELQEKIKIGTLVFLCLICIITFLTLTIKLYKVSYSK